MSWGALLVNLGVTAVVVAVLMLATFARATRTRVHAIMDTVWALGFVIIALVSFGGQGEDKRYASLLRRNTGSLARFAGMDESCSLTAARAHLGELVSRARYSRRPVVITEHGKPSVAIINIDDLADLEDLVVRERWPGSVPRARTPLP